MSKFKGTKKLTDLCREMTLEEFERNDKIFLEGELGDKFYIIFRGTVNVMQFTKMNDMFQNIERVMRKITELASGDSFGELALLHDNPRSASIIANEPTQCMVVTREVYQRVVQDVHSYQIQGTADYFASLPLLAGIPRKGLEELAGKA